MKDFSHVVTRVGRIRDIAQYGSALEWGNSDVTLFIVKFKQDKRYCCWLVLLDLLVKSHIV